VTVRERIDQLLAEPSVGDHGDPADQRLVASALLGLQLLAEEIDARQTGRTEGPPPRPSGDAIGGSDKDGLAAIVAQLAELTAQVEKLRKAVKKNTAMRKKRLKN
jgi:hypothetical protein